MDLLLSLIKNVSFNFVIVFIEFVPLLVIPFLFVGVCKKFIDFSDESRWIAPYEILFFCFSGIAAAYINFMSRGKLLENFIPTLAMALVLIFQFAGLSKFVAKEPFSSRRVLLAGTGAAICFIFYSRYVDAINS